MLSGNIVTHTKPSNNTTQANSSTSSGSTVEVQKKVRWGKWGTVKVVEAVEKIDGDCSDASDYRSKDDPLPSQEISTILEIPSFDDVPTFLESENNSTPVTPTLPSWGHWAVVPVTTIDEPFDEDDYHSGDPYSYETQQQSISQVSQSATSTEATTAAKDDRHPATIHTAARIQKAIGSGSAPSYELQRGRIGASPQPAGILSKLERPTTNYGTGFVAAHHFQQWLASGVDPQIIKLNVRSLSRKEIFQHLNLSELSERQLWQYKNILKGGWTCGNEFKPDYPRTFPGKSTPTKYENPRGQEVEPLLLKLPDKIWQAIATKYGVEKPIDIDGWEWVKQYPEIPVVIVEGTKKAGAVITSQLIPAIALPGHTAAYHKDGDVRFPEFIDPKRTIYLAFDNEYMTQKRRDVNTTIQGVINRVIKFDEKTATKTPLAKLKICQWRNEKGIDDVLITHGDKAVKEILDSALNWNDWVDDSFQALGFKPSVVFNSPKFQFVELPDTTHLIGVIAPKGTGKTWYMEQLVQQAITAKRPILSIVHRIQLGLSLANRLGLTYIDDIDGKVVDANKVSLVADSLAKIDPEKFAGGLILIDEVVQTLEHLMCGDTCKTKREKILKTLRQLGKVIVNTNAQLVIADADLNEATLRFFIGLLGDKNINPYIIENQYREKSYTCYVSQGYQNTSENGNLSNPCPADIIATLITYAQSGQRVLLCTTGQKELAKWGTSNCEKMLLAHGIADIIRIDSDTVKNPDHPAYRAISKINQLCDTYQIVIGSPSMATGISIENKNSFDLVCGIFTGVGSADATRQFLMRLRDVKAPRLIYVTNEGVDSVYSNLGTTPESVDSKSGELFTLEKAVLTRHDHEWMGEYPDINCCNTATNYFNNLIAFRNKETANYRNYVKHGLRSEGVEIIDIPDAGSVFPTSVSFAEIYEEAKEVKNNSVEFYYQKLAAQQENLLSDEEYAELKKQKDFTDPERIALEAKILSNRYGGIEITEELAAKDADGFYKKLRLHYASTVGYDLVKNTQTFSASKHLTAGEGSVLRHDFVERQKLIAQTEFIKECGLLALLDKEELSAQDPDCVSVFKFCADNKPRIHLLFNHKLQKVTADKFSFKVIQIMLDLLGLQSKQLTQKRNAGEKVNIYSAIAPCVTVDKESKDVTLEQDEREQIFAAWLERDTERAKLWEKRKRDWEIKKVIGIIHDEMPIGEFMKLRDQELFNEAWEQIATETRIKLINKVDNFTVPEPKKLFVNALDVKTVESAFQTINTWETLAADSETYGNDKPNKKGLRKEGLHKFKAELRLLQISNQDTVFTFDFGGRYDGLREVALLNVKPHFNAILNDKTKTVIGHNLNFDAAIWRRVFDSNFECLFQDTLLGLQIFFGIYNGTNLWKDGYGLGNPVNKLLDILMDKSEQKSDWGQALTMSQIDYAALDPHKTYWLWVRLKEIYENPTKFGFAKLAQWDMRKAWKLENDCIAPLAEAEHAGMPVDIKILNQLQEMVTQQLKKVLIDWEALETGIKRPTMVAKLIPYLNQKYGLNLTKGDKKVLSDYKEFPEVELRFTHSGLIQYLSRLTKLIKSAEQHNRVKTFYGVNTGTGRTASGGSFNDIVNIQSIPAKVDDYLSNLRVPSIRSAFRPVEGKALIVSDLAAAHARIACDFSKDELGTKAQNDGSDVHSLFAISLAQCAPDKFQEKGLPKKFLTQPVCIEDRELLKEFKNSGKQIKLLKQSRDCSKNIFYGRLNLASVKRLRAEVRGQLKVLITDNEAQAMSKKFEDLYPSLTKYCKDVVKKLELPENQIWIDGKLFGIHWIEQTGQRLLFDLKYENGEITVPATAIVASTWSRTEASAMKRALVLCSKLFKKHPQWNAKVINIVHDELNVECDEPYKSRVAKVVAWVMAREFQKELKNGVVHGGTDFKNEITDSKHPLFEKSIYSTIVADWSQK